MSGPEIKHTLRKTEFPVCAREALLKTGKRIIFLKSGAVSHYIPLFFSSVNMWTCSKYQTYGLSFRFNCRIYIL